MPCISVILPTYNRTEFLRSAIESVRAQTCSDWEIIVADDGSTEETRAYLRGIAGPNIHILWLEHSGNPSRVRNAAIEASTGRYLAFLDSDDLWAPTKLEKQIAALQQRPGSRWSYTGVNHVDPAGRELPNGQFRSIERPEGWIFGHLLRLDIGIAMPTVVAERDLVFAAGRFDERQRFGEFHDLCLRLAMKGEVVVVREPLCSVRVHDQHYSGDRLGDYAGWMQLYEKMADLTSDARLRSHCARIRAETSVKLARQQNIQGNPLGAWKTLIGVSTFAWRYPQWWHGMLREGFRPIVPRTLVSTLRRHD